MGATGRKMAGLALLLPALVLVGTLVPTLVAAQGEPVLAHTPPSQAYLGVALEIRVRATDDGTVVSIMLYYLGVADSNFLPTAMEPLGGLYGPSDPDVYVATIPAQQSLGNIRYYIEATDDDGAVARSPQSGEHEVPVSAEAPPYMIDVLLLLYILVPVAGAIGVVSYLVLRRRRARAEKEPRE